MRQWLAVVVDLGELRRRGISDAAGTGEQAVEVVEAAVLGIDDDDVLDAFEPARGRWCGVHRAPT